MHERKRMRSTHIRDRSADTRRTEETLLLRIGTWKEDCGDFSCVCVCVCVCVCGGGLVRHTETNKETHRDREATQHTALTQRSGAGQVLLVG